MGLVKRAISRHEGANKYMYKCSLVASSFWQLFRHPSHVADDICMQMTNTILLVRIHTYMSFVLHARIDPHPNIATAGSKAA